MGLDVYLQGSRSVFAHKYRSKEALHFNNHHKEDSYNDVIYYKEPPEYYDQQSEIHPDHLCTPYYLRSSYNEEGYDSKCELYEGTMDLYQIFDPIFMPSPPFTIITDCSKEKLQCCLQNAIKNREAWYKMDDMQWNIRSFWFQASKVFLTKAQAIEMYKDKNLQPLEVYAVIDNVVPNFLEPMIDKNDEESQKHLTRFAQPGFLIKESIEWYKQMSDIIVEFIQRALELEDPEIIFWG